MGPDILSALLSAPSPAALVTILSVQGSAPRHAGSKMLVFSDGRVLGTVGGGKGEAMAVAAGRDAIAAGKSRILRIEMLGTEAEGGAMICGGVNALLVELVGSLEPYRAAQAALSGGRRVALEKTLGPEGSGGAVDLRVRLLDRSDGSPVQDAAFSRGKATLSESGAGAVFLDPLVPAEKLLILGGGHVGRAVAAMAAPLGFQITVADDRPEFSAQGSFGPAVRTLTVPLVEAVSSFPFDPASYAIVVTRGHRYDLDCCRALMKAEYRYAGVIGSSRKIGMILDQLAADGYPAEKIRSLRAPIGLEIEAETPEEIAVAIAAELVAVRRDAPMLAALDAERSGRRSGSFGTGR